MCKAGYFGDRCDQKGCPHQCSGKGLCFEPSEDTAQCICMYGHFGLDCSESGCSKGCRHGKCMLTKLGTVHCQCEPGWAGEDCGTRVCSPCMNGKCEGMRCVCEPGYTGIDCSRRQCPDCGDRGVCDVETGTCVCHKPYFNRPGASPDCKGDERVCPNRCTSGGHGICLASGCKCLEGFGGADCSQIRCPKDCSNNGECILGKCMCKNGFTGPDCTEKVCPNQCSGHGMCVNGVCKCLRPGSAEAIASLPAPDKTLASSISQPQGLTTRTGEADDTVVPPVVAEAFFKPMPLHFVDAGFGGHDCSSRACATDCGESDGRGKCDDATGVCVCNKGFYWKRQGYDCESTICENNCSGNGLCVDNLCRCVEGFTGPQCETPVAALPNQTQSFIEQSSTLEAEINLSAEMTARANMVAVARTEIEEMLLQSERTEASTALAAMRADIEAAHEIATEEDEAIINQYLKAFSSRSAAFVQVLAATELASATGSSSLLASLGQTADPKKKKKDNTTEPTKPTPSPALKAARAKFDAEQGVVDKVRAHVKSQQSTSGAGCVASCSNRGMCVQGKCFCSGSHGDHCQFLSCPNGCSGYGKCDSTTGKCACIAGQSGPDCSQSDCVPADCNGNGVCTRNATITAAPFCKCKEGFTGPTCDVAVCDSQACSGHGLCTVTKCSKPPCPTECFCNQGFSGEKCEIGPTCKQDCGPHGTCSVDAEGNVGCECEEGWTGAACDQPYCDADSEVDCGKRGVCIRGSCRCEVGFTGPNCERRNDCSPACVSTNGQCESDANDKPVCKCSPGFGGPTCASKTCDLKCANGGTCLDGKCVCINGWRGTLCTKGCPDNCNGAARGACVADEKGAPVCQCVQPFYSPNCGKGHCPGAIFRLDGGQTFCSGHGKCNPDNGSCTCERGFALPNCATFSMDQCTKECGTMCKVGKKGIRKLTDPVTGVSKMMIPASCMDTCTKMCYSSAPR